MIYIAADHQYTNIYCRDRLIHLRAPFSDVIKQMDDCVVRVHRSYAVNPLYISHMKGTKLHLITGAQVPIPYKRVSKVRADLSKYCIRLGKRV